MKHLWIHTEYNYCRAKHYSIYPEFCNLGWTCDSVNNYISNAPDSNPPELN